LEAKITELKQVAQKKGVKAAANVLPFFEKQLLLSFVFPFPTPPVHNFAKGRFYAKIIALIFCCIHL
jgi:hypothetical protein